jgi:hypothetical protein
LGSVFLCSTFGRAATAGSAFGGVSGAVCEGFAVGIGGWTGITG